MDDRIEDRDAGYMELAAPGFERSSEFFLHNGEENDTGMGFDTPEDLVDLTCRPYQRPVVFDRFNSFKLDEARASNAMNGLTGRVGDKM